MRGIVRTHLRISLLLALGCAGLLRAQSLILLSGNGQVVQEQFLSNLPLVVEAKDASGHPAPNVAISWKITQGAGTLVRPATATDSNGQASATFLATMVPGGLSFFASTVTATSASGSVSFVITTALTRTQNGNTAAPPLVELVHPPQTDLNLTAPSGSTLAGGVVVRVIAQSGPQTGFPVPNVGLRVMDNLNPTATPPAACNGPNGLVLTDSTGTGTCDLLITGPPGDTQLTGVVGEYQDTTPFTLHITPGITCSFSLSASSQTFPASGGAGTVNVITTSGCGWTTSSNASWITVTSGTSGTGNGTVGFSIAANTGAARSGTLTIAGQTYTVNQNAGTPGSLAIATPPSLAAGSVGNPYSVTVSATGGKPPYTWSLSGTLPPGLTLNASQGIISGTPTTTGTYGFNLTVTDSAAASLTQGFSITINSASTSGFSISNVSFPSGVVGQAYKQVLSTSGGCVTPFSPSPAFRLTGGSLPPGLVIQTDPDLTRSIAGTPTASGTFSFTLTATDTCGNSATASFSIVITGSPTAPQMNVSPASLSFTVQAGASNFPADQAVTISSTSGVLNFSAMVATTSGGNWLLAKSATSGSTPGSITVGLVNFASLTPGTYFGSITISSSASNSPVIVPVSLSVLVVPTLSVSPSSFTVNQVGASGVTTTRQAIVVNSTPQVQFTAKAATQSGGSWLSVDPTQGATPGIVTAIINAAGLPAGTYVGTIAITPTGGTPQMVTITLNVLAPAVIVAAPAPVSFTWEQGSAPPASQIISLSSTAALLNLTIGTGTQSGGDWLSVKPQAGSTPLNVLISVNPLGLPQGSYQGTLNISASDPSVAPLAVPVTLTVAKPVPTIGSVTNAASFAPGPVTPGEFVTIFGSNLGPAVPENLQLDASGKVATMLGGTQVFFDNIPAPMIYTSSGQLSAIVPYEVRRKVSTMLKVEYLGEVSTLQTVRVIDSSPGVFVADASGQGAILNQDGSPNSTKNGAAPGSFISIYATGAGETDPPGVDGAISPSALPLPKPLLPVFVEINGEQAVVTYAGDAPALASGILQVNAQVPPDVPRGKSVPITITVGVATSQAGVTVAIRP